MCQLVSLAVLTKIARRKASTVAQRLVPVEENVVLMNLYEKMLHVYFNCYAEIVETTVASLIDASVGIMHFFCNCRKCASSTITR